VEIVEYSTKIDHLTSISFLLCLDKSKTEMKKKG